MDILTNAQNLWVWYQAIVTSLQRRAPEGVAIDDIKADLTTAGALVLDRPYNRADIHQDHIVTESLQNTLSLFTRLKVIERVTEPLVTPSAGLRGVRETAKVTERGAWLFRRAQWVQCTAVFAVAISIELTGIVFALRWVAAAASIVGFWVKVLFEWNTVGTFAAAVAAAVITVLGLLIVRALR